MFQLGCEQGKTPTECYVQDMTEILNVKSVGPKSKHCTLCRIHLVQTHWRSLCEQTQPVGENKAS